MSVSRRRFLVGATTATAAAPLVGAARAADPTADAAATPAAGSDGTVTFTLNGQARTLAVADHETVVEVVRDRLGLTGTKVSCGHGACGACAVIVDGVPQVSCLTPAEHLDGRTVRTIEGLTRGPWGAILVAGALAGEDGSDLHPVQRAFAAEDALQCGYCTPGFIVAAAAFHDRWRRQDAGPALLDRAPNPASLSTPPVPIAPPREPTRDDIAAALAGHLCRCGAYEAIYAAVAAACAGRYDAPTLRSARPDAREKVTGAAKYTVDQRLPGQLVGRLLRSPFASGRVTQLDVSPALQVPGVRAAYALSAVGARVRYAGQELAAVAADDRHAAEAGLRAIALAIDPLPAVFDLDASMKADAPPVYDPKQKPESASEQPLTPTPWEGNVRGPMTLPVGSRPGQARKRFAAPPADASVVRAEFRTQVQCHTAMEPHAAVAWWRADKLEVWASTQAVTWLAHDLAETFDRKPEEVVVHGEYVGGGFGAKAGYDPHLRAAVELSKAAGAPVLVALDRAEELAVGGTRPGHRIEAALLATSDGALDAMEMKSWSDSGCAVGANAALMARLIYPTPNKDLADNDVVTHGPPARPFRGPGGPPMTWALERSVDDIALARKEDPIELRLRWDANPMRQRLLRTLQAHPLWRDRGPIAKDTGRYRRGVGLASGVWFYFVEVATDVSLTTRTDGLTVATAAQDMGNGTRGALREAVLQVFDLEPHCVQVRVGDSTDPHGPMSGGSRTTASVVPTTIDAATQLAETLTRDTSARLALGAAHPTREGIAHAGGVVPWADVLAANAKRTAIGRRRPDDKPYFIPIPIGGLAIGKGLVGAVIATEVEVDTWLGRVRVTRAWGGYAAGKVVSRAGARSQACGGIVQGIGYALYEERHLDPGSGRLLTNGMEDYRIPGISDIPPIETHFDEEGFEWVNGGSVGFSEVCTVPVAASVGNAVLHATGWAPRELPLRPDRVLAGLASLRAGGAA